MRHDTFPELNDPPTRRSMDQAYEAEARLLGFVLRDMGHLDHLTGLKPQHFSDDQFRAVYAHMLNARAAGRSDLDLIVVASEIPDIIEMSDLVRIEQQADGVTPRKAASLVSRVIEDWKRRELRRATNVLGFDDAPVSESIEALRQQLNHIEAASTAVDDPHPLARFVAHAEHTPAVRWIIPGLIEHGVVTISGARGVGKTTALLPLAMVAAGLHHPDDPLAPKPGRWRHVVYIVEHVEQAQRIIAGIVRHGGLGISFEDVQERVHLVEARRLPPGEIAKVGKLYAEQFTRNVNGVAVLPLVVFDTKAAVFELENENDNSEASRAVAAIKQRFEGLPCWIIGHIAKAQFGADDVKGLSDRGAGAFEADAIQNVYLVEDAKTKQRMLLLGKRRFEARWTELGVESHAAEVVAYDEWGDEERTWLRWGILAPLPQSRAEAQEQAQEAAERERLGDMRDAIRNAVQIAWQAGNPVSKTGLKSMVSGRASDVGRQVDSLLAEGWLHEIEVPSKQRINNNKVRFLICLDAAEHDAYRIDNVIPPAKGDYIPQSWRKPAKNAASQPSEGVVPEAEKPSIPSVPEVEAENAENDPADSTA